MRIRRLLAPLAGMLALSLGTAAFAAHSDAWARPGNNNVAVYFTLSNAKAKPLTLVGASSPIAGHVAIHRSMEASEGSGAMDHMHMGMSMQNVDSLTVMSHKYINLTPGGYHLMLHHMKHALKLGDHFPVTLRFRDKSTEMIDVTVANR